MPLHLTFVVFILASSAAILNVHGEVKGYPPGVEEISFVSSGDQTSQPALFWKPEKSKSGKVPLLVGLHTWSGDYTQAGGEAVYARWCQQLGWAFIHPNFRGRNRSPESMGSDLGVADIASCVEWAKENAEIDETRIYAIGVSGGGHASMLVAAKLPEIWAGVSAWCGISDIAAWHRETSEAGRANYAKDIESALGGKPGDSEKIDKSAWNRSPLSALANAKGVALDINHGVNDGREGSVPFTHSLHAWNAVVEKSERMKGGPIDAFYGTQRVPAELSAFEVEDPVPLFGEKQPLFRKTSGNTRVTIFNGGHEIVHIAALNWLAAQKKGQPVVWENPNPVKLKTASGESESGK